MTLGLCVCVNLEYVHIFVTQPGKLTLTNLLKPSVGFHLIDEHKQIYKMRNLPNVSVLRRILRRGSTNICKNCRPTVLRNRHLLY